MSDDIETQLRAALRPVAPRKEFSERLIAQMASQHPRLSAARRGPSRWQPLAWWFSASLAASLVLAVGVHEHLQQQRLQQSGLEARREVMQALRVTSQKLNLAYDAVKSQSTSLADGGNSA